MSEDSRGLNFWEQLDFGMFGRDYEEVCRLLAISLEANHEGLTPGRFNFLGFRNPIFCMVVHDINPHIFDRGNPLGEYLRTLYFQPGSKGVRIFSVLDSGVSAEDLNRLPGFSVNVSGDKQGLELYTKEHEFVLSNGAYAKYYRNADETRVAGIHPLGDDFCCHHTPLKEKQILNHLLRGRKLTPAFLSEIDYDQHPIVHDLDEIAECTGMIVRKNR